MSRYIPDTIRQAVAERAGSRCEYCRRLEADSFLRHQVDHIISLKHGGLTTLENLAYCCSICNYKKGTDLATILEDEEILVRLFHPRKHNWFDHFEVSEGGGLLAKTDIGRATIKVLNLNEAERIMERIDLIKAGVYP